MMSDNSDNIHAQNREVLRRERARGAVPSEVYYERAVFTAASPPPAPKIPATPPVAKVTPPTWPFDEMSVRYCLAGPLGVRAPGALSPQARAEIRRLRHRAVLVAAWRTYHAELVAEAERLKIGRFWGRYFFAERAAR